MDNSSLQIDIEKVGSIIIVIPLGDIDLSKSSELRVSIRSALDDSPTKINIDLAHVPYMDSSGIATMIEGLQLSKQSDIVFILCALCEGVQSIIELARLDQIFTIIETREQALSE